MAGRDDPDTRVQRGGRDRDVHRLHAGFRLPALEVLVLDDGWTDDTEAVALAAAEGDARCRVHRDPVNRGKAEQLNAGFREARHELVAVTDAGTHVHPEALKLLVARMERFRSLQRWPVRPT